MEFDLRRPYAYSRYEDYEEMVEVHHANLLLCWVRPDSHYQVCSCCVIRDNCNYRDDVACFKYRALLFGVNGTVVVFTDQQTHNKFHGGKV